MSHFLIVYRRSPGQLLECKDLGTDWSTASAERARLESLHRTDIGVEVVLLTAPSRSVLEQTHSRYFKTFRELAEGLSALSS